MTANNGHSHESPISRVDFPHEVILITGAGGSIGSALAKQIVGSKLDSANADLCRTVRSQHARVQHGCAPSQQDAGPTVLLLDHSEQNLYEINSELSPGRDKRANHIAILGDVNDAALLDDIFEKYRPTTIFHAAAFKHVPLMEENPIAVIRNNILGTWTLATTAAQYRAHQLTMISTDKAANPRSIMGAAKRVAEQILTRLDSPATRMRSIRLGNVLGSTGSVVPLFQRQIESGGPVTVTHPDARRYFLSLDEATDLILAAAVLEDAATRFRAPTSRSPRQSKSSTLAKNLISEAHRSDAAGANPIEIVFTGLRPGDKLSEDLLSSSEFAEPTNHPRLRRITGPTPTAKSHDAAITLISENVQARALPALLDAIRALVRDYEPSDLISAQISPHLSITAKA